MDEFELDGAHAEIERLAALSQCKKPLYGNRFLSKRTPGTEAMGAPPDVQLTHDDILGAVRELAEQHGVSSARVRGLLMLTAVRAGIGHSPEEEAQALNQVMLAMDAGKMNVSDEQILALSGRSDDTAGLASGLPDVAHLQAAAVLCRSGTGDWKDAGQLIAKRARELGVPDPLGKGAVAATPDTMRIALSMAGAGGCGDAEAALAGQTQETRALRMAAGGQDSAEAAIARHPELSFMFKGGRTSSRRHPAKSGRAGMVTSASRAHASDLDDDTRDYRQPARGGEVHADVRRLIEANPDLFTDGKGHEGGSGNRSYAPSPYRPPGPSGKPQSSRWDAGGRMNP